MTILSVFTPRKGLFLCELANPSVTPIPCTLYHFHVIVFTSFGGMKYRFLIISYASCCCHLFILLELSSILCIPKLMHASHLTFLASILMTVNAFHVIPFVFVFNTKCMYTVFIPKIIWLVFGPSCKVPRTTICPSKGSLCENVIQSQPGFCSIVKML